MHDPQPTRSQRPALRRATRRWRRNGRAFLGLSGRDRRLLLEACGWLLLFRTALRLLPLQRLQRLAATRRHHAPLDPSARDDLLARVRWAVIAAAENLPGSSRCLPRALTAQRLLARRGVPSELRLGFARNDQRLVEGHAWLEHDGRVIIGEEELERFGRATTAITAERRRSC